MEAQEASFLVTMSLVTVALAVCNLAEVRLLFATSLAMFSCVFMWFICFPCLPVWCFLMCSTELLSVPYVSLRIFAIFAYYFRKAPSI